MKKIEAYKDDGGTLHFNEVDAIKGSILYRLGKGQEASWSRTHVNRIVEAIPDIMPLILKLNRPSVKTASLDPDVQFIDGKRKEHWAALRARRLELIELNSESLTPGAAVNARAEEIKEIETKLRAAGLLFDETAGSISHPYGTRPNGDPKELEDLL